ncbi:hypothetical protein CCHR01_19137 [Colletotrichum chrysophilum]|uniref:Uncharacterized protein n=1 Tax=Colletotrichum chrysophilum TaxID=1836956 RepID=A0AAD8ZYU4_9PEZI|nr:hypothetical protein CCHR01_19137 [Colletotrichum chrysophilum]
MCQRRHRQRRRRVRWGLMFALAASKPDDVVHFKPRITGLALHVVRFGLRMDPFFSLSGWAR